MASSNENEARKNHGTAPPSLTPRQSPTKRSKQQFSPRSQTQQSARARNSTTGGSFYGIIRKTKKKTYGALYRGRKQRRVVRGEGAGEGGEADYSSDSSSSVAEELNYSIGRRDSRGMQPHVGGGVGVEPARSFYFSPQNSWEHAVQNNWDHGAGLRPYNAEPGRNNSANVMSPHQQQASFPDNEAMKKIVCDVERILRQVVLCGAMFIAGTMMPEQASMAYHVLELSFVAWGTCSFIVLLGWYQSFQQQRRVQQYPTQATTPPSMITTQMTNNIPQQVSTQMMNNPPGQTAPTQPAIIERVERATYSTTELSSTQTELSKKRSHDAMIEPEPVDDSEPPYVMREMQQPISIPIEQQQHPSMQNLYVMVVGKQERVFPNATIYEIDNDLFSGKMLLMFRTSDVDEPTTSNDPIVNYFRGKQRRFEFQWQFQLKRLPPGDVFFGAELDEPIQMGMIQRALSNAALKFVKKLNQGFTYFLSESTDIGPSYLSFPLGTSMDRFHVTKPGEEMPVLGQEVMEDAEQMKLRKKGKQIEWNTDNVYTMAVWSAYFDWIDWQILK